jgi:sugar phosphate permease
VAQATAKPDAELLPLGYALHPPTRVRLGVLAFLCTMALLLYVDRVCIGQPAASIRADLGLSTSQMALVFTVFSLAYAIFEVPAGHWGDRHGSRGVIARVVIWWSLFTALTGAAVGLWSLLFIRFLFGAGEAGAFPNAARVVTRWFPEHERGRARGTITFVSLVGAAVAPPVSAYLIGFVGWRWTFVIFGMLGVAWAIAFYAWFRDDPAQHPGTNDAELAVIGIPAEPEAADAARAHGGIPWSHVLASPNVWLLGWIMTVSGMLFYMQFQWYPTYLKDARGQSEVSSGWLTMLVMSGGAIGCLSGGWVSDFVLRTFPDRRRARRISGGGALLLAAGFAFAVRFADSPLAVTLCHAAALFFMQLGVPTWWSVVAEVSGRHGAAMWGLMNSMASLGLMGVNLFVGWVVDARQRAGLEPVRVWFPVFDAVAIGLALGAVCWLLVDPARSIVERAGGATGDSDNV